MAERASKVPVEKFSSERSERRKVFAPKAAAGGLARAGHPATIGGQKGNQTRQGPVAAGAAAAALRCCARGAVWRAIRWPDRTGRYGICWLASGDTIVPWNDSGLAA